jgi:hypothetical protein
MDPPPRLFFKIDGECESPKKVDVFAAEDNRPPAELDFDRFDLPFPSTCSAAALMMASPGLSIPEIPENICCPHPLPDDEELARSSSSPPNARASLLLV